MGKLLGIDISHWQKGIEIKNVEADFIIVKATQGTSKKDECLDSFASAIQSTNRLFGVYHFADGKSSGAKEAEWFVKNIKQYIGKAILVLDWEADALKQGPVYAKEFCDTVVKLTGVLPILYCSTSVIRNSAAKWKDFADKYPYVWLAEYGANKERSGYADAKLYNPRKISGFEEVIRQYSSKTSLPGFRGVLDANISYIDKTKWASFCKSNIVAKEEPKPAATKMSVQEAAQKILDGVGEWKVNGSARVKKLTEAGYDAKEVQTAINKLIAARQSTPKSKEEYYIVQHRDTLSKIAKDHNMALGMLIKLNPQISNINAIKIGQKIRVK